MSKKHPNAGRPERSWSLVKASLSDYRADWKPYVKILAIVTIPFNLVTLAGFASVDVQTVGYYGSFATIIMNVALLWAMLQRAKGNKVTVPSAYYTGVGQIVSYLLTSAALVGMLIPLAIGFKLYSAVSTPDVGTTPPEVAIVGALALLIALPSLYLMVRYGLALLLVMTDNLRPVAALRRARRLTLGRFWPIAGRLVLLGVFIVVLAIPLTLITTGLELVKLQVVAVAFFQIAITLTLLPIAYLYLLRLLRSLELQPASERAPAAKVPAGE